MANEVFDLVDEYKWGELIDKPKLPVIIEFYTPWCVPSQELKVVVEAAAKKHKNIKFFRYNMDKFQSRALINGIVGVPTILFMKPNEDKTGMFVFKKVKGYLSLDMLNNYIDNFLAQKVE